MSDHDSFEDRLRAFAEEVNRSVQRISEVDMEELSQRYGVDADRARAFADAAGRWLSGHLSAGDPLFGDVRHGDQGRGVPPASGDLEGEGPSVTGAGLSGSGAGPHPLDLASDGQGVALSALDSGRWTVRPGSDQLTGTGTGSAPTRSDVVGELRARDWITAAGTLTLVGRHALGRWCRTVQDPAPAAPEADPPPT
jgi:hypothetical protein